MGVEPSGNEYSIDEIHILRIEDGKVIEHWHEFDKQRLMQQLQGKAQRATNGRERREKAGDEARRSPRAPPDSRQDDRRLSTQSVTRRTSAKMSAAWRTASTD